MMKSAWVDYARWHATEDRGNPFCPPAKVHSSGGMFSPPNVGKAPSGLLGISVPISARPPGLLPAECCSDLSRDVLRQLNAGRDAARTQHREVGVADESHPRKVARPGALHVVIRCPRLAADRGLTSRPRWLLFGSYLAIY
jgi:hypothetical protein